MSITAPTLAQALASVAELHCAGDEFAGLSDADLMECQAQLAQAEKRIRSFSAMAAGEIARRSTREHGFDGLAQRTGCRTPASLVQKLTGASSREAFKLVAAGAAMHASVWESASVSGLGESGEPGESGDAPSGDPGTSLSTAGVVAPAGLDLLAGPWLRSVGEALVRGILSVDAATAIRVGLGAPNDSVSVEQLAGAATALVAAAMSLNADELGVRARAMRDDLDLEGIAVRERDMRSKEYLRIYKRPDGMVAGSFLYAPENAAILTSALDAVTAPRRGGPRMVDETERAREVAITSDTRTTEKINADALVDMIRIAGEADQQTVFGIRRPAVHVLTTATALQHRRGRGHIEGATTSVSIATVERIACADGTVAVTFDDHGQPLDVGRTQRTFTHRQRIALAARDGGCMAPGCDRPPSWTEAHHIKHWLRDRGATDIANGILLCRYHHLLLHDGEWEIERRDDSFWMIPPAAVDPHRTPIRLLSKSAAFRDLRREPEVA